MGHSGRESEELVDQTDFAYRAELGSEQELLANTR
jgi:hypothetical protein